MPLGAGWATYLAFNCGVWAALAAAQGFGDPASFSGLVPGQVILTPVLELVFAAYRGSCFNWLRFGFGFRRGPWLGGSLAWLRLVGSAFGFVLFVLPLRGSRVYRKVCLSEWCIPARVGEPCIFGTSPFPEGIFSEVLVPGDVCGVKPERSFQYSRHNRSTFLEIPDTVPFASVSSGYDHGCGVKTDGSVKCWGDDTFGQAYSPPGTFVSVGAGRRFSCGLKTDGTAMCWGRTIPE